MSVSATSKQGDNSAEKAVDSDINSRWESVHGADPQSFLIDLGKVKAVRQIDIIWEAASAKTYSIDLSEDGINYTSEATVNSDNSNQNRYDSIKLNNARNARYVRINCIARTTGYGYSIFDLAIYGITESTEQTTSEPDTTNEGNDKNIAENKTAVSSGDEGENVAAKYAVDGNKGTRWSSDFDNNAWMYVDFGKEYKVSKVILIWESAYGKSYDIQISNDGVNWTTVKEMRGQDGGEDIIEFNAVTARYLKLQGIERATGYGYSLWEMEVYGENSVSGEETNNPAVSGQNVAVNKNVIQSGSESSSMAADKAVDGNTNTRWSSDFNDNAWMYVDLGNTYAVNKINILWENAYGKEYDIQVSNDGINWITVKEMRNQDGGEDVVEFNTVNARYVKFQGVKRAIGYGYSMWEFEVLAK